MNAERPARQATSRMVLIDQRVELDAARRRLEGGVHVGVEPCQRLAVRGDVREIAGEDLDALLLQLARARRRPGPAPRRVCPPRTSASQTADPI